MKKTIVISGVGPNNLGEAIARKLHSEYRVVILARTEVNLRKIANELGCEFQVCDISNPDSVALAVKNITRSVERIDCLINCAAARWVEGELEQNTPEEIIQTINTNVIGTLLFTRGVIPYMKKQKSGFIININSQAGFYAKAGRSLYVAAKWAMTGFTKSLQQELESYGIRVVGMYPGRLSFSMVKKEGKTERTDAISLEGVAKTVQFVLSFEDGTTFPEIGIERIIPDKG